MKRCPLEFLGRVNARPKFSKTKKIECIFFDNLKNKNILRHTLIVLPFHNSNYDYCKDIQELLINCMQLRTFVTRHHNQKSNTFIYHIYLYNSK